MLEVEDLKKCKIYVENAKMSFELQNILFKLGFTWAGHIEQKPRYLDMRYLFLDSEKSITYCSSFDFFIGFPYYERSARKIIEIFSDYKKSRKKKTYIGVISNRTSLREIYPFSEERFKAFLKEINILNFKQRIFKVKLTDKQYDNILSLIFCNKTKTHAENLIRKNKDLVWLSKELF